MPVPKSTKLKYKINSQFTVPNGVAGNYRKGYAKPEGVVMHSSGNPNAGIDSEIAYMSKNYGNAFTHAWAGHNKIVEIANTNYACWGVGPIGNPRFVQIEVTEDKRLSSKQKLQAIDRGAFWCAVQLNYYNLPCKNAEGGNGTVWSHNSVSKYLGGTDHTDPINFFKKAGTNWAEFYNQVKAYYDIIKQGGDTNRVVSIADKQGNKAVVKSPNTPKKNHATKKDSKGRSTQFMKGELVKLQPTATHWQDYYDKVIKDGGRPHGRTKISNDQKQGEYVVTWLPTDGLIELAPIKNDKKGKERFKALDRDLVGFNKNAKSFRDNLYKVQSGAFLKKENAEQHAKKIQKDGYDTFITKE